MQIIFKNISSIPTWGVESADTEASGAATTDEDSATVGLEAATGSEAATVSKNAVCLEAAHSFPVDNFS